MLEPNTLSKSRSVTRLFRNRFPLVTFVWILLALSVGLLFMGSLNRFFDHDEFEAMHTAWYIFQGERIYEDFIQHHFPLLHYLLVPLYALFGSTTDTIIAARVVMFFNVLGMLAATYLIALEVYRKHLVAVVGTLFLTLITLFTAKAIEIRPDVPQSLFVMVGAYLVLRGFRTPLALDLYFGRCVLRRRGTVLTKGHHLFGSHRPRDAGACMEPPTKVARGGGIFCRNGGYRAAPCALLVRH